MAKDKRVSALDRVVMMAMGEGREVGLPDDPAAQVYPALWDWMTRIYCGKEHIKQPASLTITLTPEGVLCKLTDRDLAASVEVVCRHLQECFQTIEDNLNSDKPALRIFGRKEPKLRKRQTK